MLGHAAKYAVARWVPGLLNFAAIALYTRLLTEAEYGRYAVVLAWVTLLNTLGFEWLRAGVRRFFVSEEGDPRRFFSTIRGLFVRAVGVVAGCVAVALPFAAEDRFLLVAGFALLIAWAWIDLTLEVTLARVRPGRYSAALLTRSTLALGAAGYLAYQGYGALGLLAGVAFGFAMSALYISTREGTLGRGISIDRAIVARLAKYGLPLTLSAGLLFIVNVSDRLLLDWMRGPATVGPYAAAYDLVQMGTTVLVMPINLIAVPMAVRAAEEGNREALEQHLVRTSTWLVGIGLPVAVGFGLGAPTLTSVVLGEGFRREAIEVMPLIACAALIGALKVHYFDLAFVLGRETRGQLVVSGVAAAVNVAANLAFIPRLGAVGAAWATVLSLSVGLALSVGIGRRVLAIPFPWSRWAVSALASAPLVLWLFFLGPVTGVRGLAMMVAGAVVLFATAALLLDIDELRSRLVRRRAQ